MTPKQLNLLDLAISELNDHKHRGLPISLKTVDVVKRLKISAKSLNHAKNTGKLPYKCSCPEDNTKIAEIYFSHTEKRRDYWRIYEKDKTAN